MAFSNPRMRETPRKQKAAIKKLGKVKLRLVAWLSGPPTLEEKQTPVDWRYQQKRKGTFFRRGGDNIECKCGNTHLRVLRRVRGRITLYARHMVSGENLVNDPRHGHLAWTFHSRTECRPQTQQEIDDDYRRIGMEPPAPKSKSTEVSNG